MAEENSSLPDEGKPIIGPTVDEEIGKAEADLLRIMHERYTNAQQHDRDNRDSGREDLEFLAGDMWPEEIKLEREDDGRPILTIDRISQALAQVTGDIRQSNPSIKVRPSDGAADGDMAETLTGQIRHIESQSDASTAYITGAESAAQCGIGHFRIVTQYSSDDTFDQDIRIKRIIDPFSVTWDPHAIEVTREDARYCFFEESLDIPEFKARYPNAALDSFESNQGDNTSNKVVSDWFQHQTVRVAEYWTKTPEERKLILTVDNQTVDATDFEEVDMDALMEQSALAAEEAQATGEQIELPDFDTITNGFLDPEGGIIFATRLRKVIRNKIEMRIVSGAEVLEGPFTWPGQYIPIIPVIGEEIHLQNKTVRMGMVRRAKDPQRLYNIWRSAQTEKIALEPKVPWVVTTGNISGVEDIWKQANRRNLAYLPYVPDPINGGKAPQRNAPQMGSGAMAQDIQIAVEDMKATTRVYDAGLGQRSNETSGKAIQARQRESDNGTFVYINNLTRALRHCGRILVDLIPKVYDTERTLRILNEDGTVDTVSVNVRAKDDKTDSDYVMNDISIGEYDVIVQTGPAYTTKREEAAEGMIALAQAAPDKAALFMDIIVQNLDWPGADQIAERLKKMLPPGLVEPEEGEEEMPPPPPTPEQIKVEADIAKDQAEQGRKTEETGAKVAKLRAETDAKELENVQKALEIAATDGSLAQLIQEQVRIAMAGQMPPAMATPPNGAPAVTGPGPQNGGMPPAMGAGPQNGGMPPAMGADASVDGFMDLGDGIKIKQVG